TVKTNTCKWSETELYRQGVRSCPATRKTTDAQPTEMRVYGIKIVRESETVSKFPLSITAIIVANATKRRSANNKIKRCNDPHPGTLAGRKPSAITDFPAQPSIALKYSEDCGNFATL